jgi:curved DNA-binding protein CbpA
MSSIDKRTFKRYKKETDFKLKLKTGIYDCKTVDYSANGMCIHIFNDTSPLSKDDMFEFTFQDPELYFYGEVIWIKEVDNGYKVGLKRTGNLKGNYGDFQLADIMIGLQRTMKTGVLEVIQDKKLTKIHVKNGDYIFASSNHKDDSLEEFLVKRGSISLQQYLEVNKKLKKTREKIGKILVELGYLMPSEIYKAVKQQVQDIILSIFTAKFDSFEFKEGPLPTEETLTLNMSAANLIYKGVKRATNSQYILEDLPSLDSILCFSKNPTDLFQDISLDDKDKEILSMVNSNNTLEDILSAYPAGDLEIVKKIYALLCARIIVIKTDDTHQEVSLEEIIQEPHQEINTNFIEEANKLFDKCKTKGLYDILDVQVDATDKEIKKVYLKLARTFHPDRHFTYNSIEIKEKLTEIFTQINLAYSTLSNPEKRRQYDKTLLKKPVKKSPNTKIAEDFFNEAKSIMEDIKLYNSFGEVNTKMITVRFTKAEQLISKAIYFDNSKSEYHFYYGIALSRLQKNKEAVKVFNKAIEINPSNSRYYAELGHLSLNLGFTHRAKRAFSEALKITPSDKRALEGKRILEKQ